MPVILDNIYIWVFSINSESVLLLALVKYMLCVHFTQNCIFCSFWKVKILVFWREILENLLIFVYLFCPKNGAIDFTKTLIPQKWLVIESCPTPRWIAFLMLYPLVYNIRSRFNELILVWSAYVYCKKQRKAILKKKLLGIIYLTKKQFKKRQKIVTKIWQTNKKQAKKNWTIAGKSKIRSEKNG